MLGGCGISLNKLRFSAVAYTVAPSSGKNDTLHEDGSQLGGRDSCLKIIALGAVCVMMI